METITTIFQGTPWWVYVLFAYLIYLGVRSLKGSVFSLKKILILPSLFFVLAIWLFILRMHGWKDLLIFVIFAGIGYFIGLGITHSLSVRADKKKLLVKLSKSKTLLVLFVAIFLVKYAIGQYQAMHVESRPILSAVEILLAGSVLGIFIGRCAAILKKFGKAPHEKLYDKKEKKAKPPRSIKL